MPPTPKLTPQVKRKIGDSIKKGTPLKYAAETAGISESGFFLWMKKGKEAKSGVYFEFYEYIMKCEAEAVNHHIQIIEKAGREGNWQASAWILERRHPEDFGRKDRMNVDANVNHSGGVVIYIPEDGRDPSESN